MKNVPRKLAVYAVWFNMYPGDSRAAWPAHALTDSRVTQFWDEPRRVGTMFLSQLPTILDRRAPGTLQPFDDAMWDAFFVYTARDRWTEAPPLPVAWGYPIMVTRETLASEIHRLLDK